MNTLSPSLQSLKDHPVITASLGIAPLVVMAQTILSAAIMALSFSVALMFSMLSVSRFRRLIPNDYRLPVILLISSSWVTIIDFLLQAVCYEMRAGLDFYIPLIAMNSLLLWMLEETSLKRAFMADLIPASITCTIVIIICVISGGIRELLVHGSVLTDISLLFPEIYLQSDKLVAPAWNLPIMATSAGALLVLGCVLAGINLAVSQYYGNNPRSQSAPAPESGENGIEQ